MRINIGFVVLDKRFRRTGLLVCTGRDRSSDRSAKVYSTPGHALGAVKKSGFPIEYVEVAPAYITIPRDTDESHIPSPHGRRPNGGERSARELCEEE